MALSGPAPLHGRHRDKNGEVSKKHGNTLIGTLRKTYGAHFAPGCDDTETLARCCTSSTSPRFGN